MRDPPPQLRNCIPNANPVGEGKYGVSRRTKFSKGRTRGGLGQNEWGPKDTKERLKKKKKQRGGEEGKLAGES